ncbi:hypothetical protein IRT45_27615 [Nocardia sp. BSTN01]|uniref:hypothetical protein n=1 Tax=Nocardia sp. BSTN01 TaxID=2783665 RepID=UPI00188FB3E4|nr:hypothetical protein [Nocardia sp. BSTN01]MBF5000912.1 hypothetical protein [Nocardia sp. BSTN01]
MRKEDQELILQMVSAPGSPATATPDEILVHFGETDGIKLGSRLLNMAVEHNDADELELSLIVCSVFGFDDRSLPILCELESEAWHHSHEDIVQVISAGKDPRFTETLYHATQWVPDYLAFDEHRALAVKAIWGLGPTPGRAAQKAIDRLSLSDEEVIREAATQQLDRRRSS